MASYLWSNPDPSNQTSAALSAGYKVDAANIGPIIAAIMEDRRRAQAMEQAQMDQMLKSVSSAAGSLTGAYMQNREQNINEDTARAAMYFSQNPQSYQDYVESGGQIPAGVTEHGSNLNDAALLKAVQDLRNDQIMNQYKLALTNQANRDPNADKVYSDQAGGYVTPYQNAMLNRTTQQQSSGRPTSASAMHEERIAARQQMAASLGVSDRDLDAAIGQLNAYQPGVTAFPNVGAYQQGNETPGPKKDELLAAMKQYLSRGQPQPAPQSQATSPGVRQGDVDQAQQSMSQEDKYPIGTRGKSGGVWYVKTAQGWVPE